MRRSASVHALFAILVLAALGSGCDSESGLAPANREPNTRISLAPPERSDTSYLVDIFWFGFDDDGEVSHYEIAWERPEDWLGPIFSTDSLFVLEASETCCVDPLPDYGIDLPDSVYEQFHTFFVRAVDDDGDADPTPAFRSFNSKTIAPHTRVTFGPDNLQFWGTNVEFEWIGEDDDGTVVGYEFLLSNGLEFQYEFGHLPTIPEMAAWIDTLTYRPLPGGGYSGERVWKPTLADSTVLLGVPPISGATYYFAVRAIDNAGAKERVLDSGDNLRRFNTAIELDGPRLSLISNIAGIWTTGSSGIRDVFQGQGLRFRWIGRPGQSQAGVAGYSYSVEDTSSWSPFSENSTEWPVQVEPNPPEELWFPTLGIHSFFLRAVDFSGFIRVLVGTVNVLPGPTGYSSSERYILAVLDSDPTSLSQGSSVWPPTYTSIERAIVEYFLDGFNFQIFQTNGTLAPRLSLMDRASTIIWLLSGDVESGVDSSILEKYHADRREPNVLPSYVRSGGNLFLCGIEPVNAIKYFDNPTEQNPTLQGQFPIDFSRTLTDTTYVPHWAVTELGILRIDGTIPNEDAQPVLALASSQITLGTPPYPDNPYPDLPFDPLSTYGGTISGGMRYFDFGVIPTTAAEVIYRNSSTGQSIGVRKLTSPGVNGNTVYLGFHPYFVQKSAFRNLIRAVLKDFGEVYNP